MAKKKTAAAAIVDVPTSRQSTMRRFVLKRKQDVSGTSGEGTVAEGVEFSNGRCTISWLSPVIMVTVCDSIAAIEKIHGHDGSTVVEYIDEK